MAHPYQSTQGTTNMNRMSRVLLGPCTDQLREVLRRHVPPASFPNIIKNKKGKLPRLTSPQMDIILPRNGHYSGDYSDMDISLLYVLLRNICDIQPHGNGWGNSPDDTDFTLSASIERIREIRNKTGHSSNTSLSQIDFVDQWSDIKRSVKVIDKFLKNGNKYQRDVDFLLVESMDPELANLSMKQLNEQVTADPNTMRTAEETHHSFKRIEEIRSLILPINESEADRIQILPFKTDDTIGVDSIFVPISITDEYDKRSSSTTEEVLNQSLSPGGIFTVQSGKKARFVFMLGEAGYGKTVQCQRIAKSWCQAWKNENELGEGSGVPNYELKTSLKQFDLLVFVTMRDIRSEHVNLTDMIKDVYSRYRLPDESLDDIVRILKYGNYRSLVLLDGLDEWNIPDDKKQCLLDKCIPNCRDLPNSSVLISMRSWKFMEVEQICRASIDRVIRLNGLDEDGVKELTTNMLQNYLQNQDIEESKRRFDKVKNTISSASFELKSLMKIPLLAVFCILTLYEDIETGNSQTTFYLSIIEALIKRSIKKNQIEQPKTYTDILYVRTATGILQNYPLVSKYMPQLSRLGKVAFDSLTSKTSELVFSADQLNELLGDETVEFYLRVGLVTKSEISGKFHEDNVRISFLHKTIHEFLATLYIFYGRTVEEIEEIVQSEVINIDKALEYSPVLSFFGGLSPAVGCRISSFIKNLTNKDEDIKKYRFHFDSRSYQKMFYLYNLQLRCYKEVRGTKSIEAFEDEGQTLKFSFSDVILLSTDTDVLTIRDSAKVMKFHPNDIISLNMVCIPNNDEEGISNAVVKTFLDESQSITSIYIDGYIDGKCRLIDEYSPKMFQLKTLGLSNVAFRDNILANLITKEESKEVIRALGILYLKSEEDEVIDFEYRIPSIHWRNTTKSGFRRYAYSKKTGANFGPQRMQRTPFLGNFLESLPDYKQLSTLHITYMEAEEDRQKLLQVLPKLNQLHDIAYSGSNRYPYPDYGYDATVISNITNLEKLQEVDLRSISLKESVLNFENLSKLKEISLDAFKIHTANGWEMLFESFSKIETLQKIFLYDTNVAIEVLDEYKNIRGSVCIEKMDRQTYEIL